MWINMYWFLTNWCLSVPVLCQSDQFVSFRLHWVRALRYLDPRSIPALNGSKCTQCRTKFKPWFKVGASFMNSKVILSWQRSDFMHELQWYNRKKKNYLYQYILTQYKTVQYNVIYTILKNLNVTCPIILEWINSYFQDYVSY